MRATLVESAHVPPLAQGDEAHSLMSRLQLPPCAPVTLHCAVNCVMWPVAHIPRAQPTVHKQLYALIGMLCPLDAECTHVAPFVHGCDTHSLKSASHRAPVYPAAHVHLYASTPTAASPRESTQDPPLKHGDDAHSLTSVLHCVPDQPAAHEHTYAATLTPAFVVES